MDNLKNIEFLLKDLLYGDESVANREDYASLTGDEIYQALSIIINNQNLNESQKKYFIDNTWRISYFVRPPSMEEFLTPQWIGAVADKIYPHVKDVLISYMNPLARKRVLALSTCIGYGKSTLSTIIAVYIIIHLSYMRSPKLFFNLNEMGSIVVALMSFTQKKVNQLLLQPFHNLLRSSPIFERVRQEDRLEQKQKEIKRGHIAYTSAGRMGAFQFAKDVHITIASDRADLLGLNIILGIVSEISFWIKRGVSIDEIWGAFSDMRERVNSRFAHRYLSGVILDSSPLDLSLSPIDKWIYQGEARQDPEVMTVHSKHWDIFPEKYPQWRKTGETIPVFRGDAGRPPKVLSEDVDKYPEHEILRFPIDTQQSLKNPSEMKKIVADLAGWPAGGILKLIDDIRVLNTLFTDNLNNVYTYIEAPENQHPERLIWNKIVDKFFIKINNSYEIYRAPKELRTIHIDLAESTDMASIAMNHLEFDEKTGNNVIINDFTIVVSPMNHRINLDAISTFILDLKNLGKINFHKITADQYQSSSMLQRLQREGLEVSRLSVDKDTTPYRTVVSWILNERIKVGRNIFLKNNLLSLQEIVTDKGNKKIDHTYGSVVYDDGADWIKSGMGINAKDASDAFVGSCFILITEFESYIPRYQWSDIDISKEKNNNDNDNGINESILKKLNEKFNVKVN